MGTSSHAPCAWHAAWRRIIEYLQGGPHNAVAADGAAGGGGGDGGDVTVDDRGLRHDPREVDTDEAMLDGME